METKVERITTVDDRFDLDDVVGWLTKHKEVRVGKVIEVLLPLEVPDPTRYPSLYQGARKIGKPQEIHSYVVEVDRPGKASIPLWPNVDSLRLMMGRSIDEVFPPELREKKYKRGPYMTENRKQELEASQLALAAADGQENVTTKEEYDEYIAQAQETVRRQKEEEASQVEDVVAEEEELISHGASINDIVAVLITESEHRQAKALKDAGINGESC